MISEILLFSIVIFYFFLYTVRQKSNVISKDFIHMECECPQCGSKAYKRNGYTRHGKQNHRCLDCGRQFSLEPTYIPAASTVLFLNNITSQNQMEVGMTT